MERYQDGDANVPIRAATRVRAWVGTLASPSWERFVRPAMMGALYIGRAPCN